MIYLDYSANSPVDDRVLDNYVSVTKKYIGNPNSSHKVGLEAKNIIDECSIKIAKYFGASKESVIYTSGSSESNNLVIKGVCELYKNKGKHIIISPIEHSSVVAPLNYLCNKGFEVTVLSLTKDGIIDLEELKNSIREDTILVSICSVDSELGTIEPIKEIVNIVKEHNIIFHTDATQAIGKIDIDYTGCDFITFAPHKFYGINGSGVLMNMNNIKIMPLIHGGRSTTIFRSGTPVTANASSTSVALELAVEDLSNRYEYVSNLKKYLIDELSKLDYVHINSPKNSIPNTLNFSLTHIKASEVVEKLEKKDIYLSTVSACSMKNSPSKSVFAITGSEELSRNSIRVSLSHLTSLSELKIFIKEFISICEELKNENN